MRELKGISAYLTDEQRKKIDKRKGEVGIRFDSVYLTMLITRDLKTKEKF